MRKLCLFLIFILSFSIVTAWTPQENIDLRNVYNITNTYLISGWNWIQGANFTGNTNHHQYNITNVSNIQANRIDVVYLNATIISSNASLVANVTDLWDTNEGIIDNVVDILGSWITNNLNWINKTQTDSYYYNKSEIENNFSNYYTATEINNNLSNYYNQTEIDSLNLSHFTDDLNYSGQNTNASEFLITNEGIIDNVIDIMGSWINNNLNWVNMSQIFSSIGNFSAWDKDYSDLINTPTALSNFTDDLNYTWDNITNIPSGFSDKIDNDTFVSYDCPSGQFVQNISGNVSECATPTNSVDTHVAGDQIYLYNDSTTMYINETKLNQTIDDRGTGATYTAGSNLTLSGTIFSANMTAIKEYFDTIYSAIGSAFSGSWNDLTDIPAGFSDGVDNDTADTNETIRFNNLVGNCSANNFVFGIDENGNKVCLEDQTGTGGKSADGIYLYNNSNTIYFNETKLNNTIDLRAVSGGNTTEEMQDAVGGSFNITLNYDDANNKIGVNQTWLNSIYTKISNLVGMVGNWTLDKPNYFNKTESWNNVSGSEWITPSQVLDIDDADIESDLNTYVDIAGDTMEGNLSMGTNNINAVADPLQNQDAATKKYVDDNIFSGSNVSKTMFMNYFTMTQNEDEEFMQIQGKVTSNSDRDFAGGVVAYNSTATRLVVDVRKTSIGVGQTATFTLVKNAVDTNMEITFSEGLYGYQIYTGSIPLEEGDVIYYKFNTTDAGVHSITGSMSLEVVAN